VYQTTRFPIFVFILFRKKEKTTFKTENTDC